MNPQEFLKDIVVPNVSDFHQNFADLRHAYNAVSAIDALAAHLFVWAKISGLPEVRSIADDTLYRAELATRNSSFALLRDIAKAQKHVHLTRGNPQVTQASQVSSRAIGWGEGGYGLGRYGGPPQVVVDVTSNEFYHVEQIVDEALTFLEAEMATFGLGV